MSLQPNRNPNKDFITRNACIAMLRARRRELWKYYRSAQAEEKRNTGKIISAVTTWCIRSARQTRTAEKALTYRRP